ncbi:hypothetical protein PYCCODRAFT_1221895 [Trametes coccinea BRFM310]|uniref:Uncharacterized protein n=1 Tax=Trametes coccinea (strain BRFM310) TaxID=1353009 RepID=A0A1Y2IXF3_TRAC3|nr:hypothetical protein PYCCODRAFT_1221895 [Trametes coccinea BRFM310]
MQYESGHQWQTSYCNIVATATSRRSSYAVLYRKLGLIHVLMLSLFPVLCEVYLTTSSLICCSSVQA